MSSEQRRWARQEGDFPIGHALVYERKQIYAIPQLDGTWIVRQPGTRERQYDNLEQINAEIDAMQMNENPQRQENGPGLGGFLGSLGGVIVGSVIAAIATPAVAVPVAVALSAGGGALGARYAAESDNKKSATTWGGVGGIFGPIGAGIGGYFAGKEGRRENPSTTAVIVGTSAVVGTVALVGYGVHRWRKKKAEALPPAAVANPRRRMSAHRPRRLSLRA